MWGHEVTLGGLLYAEMVAKQLNGTLPDSKITPCGLNITRSGLFSMYLMGIW